MHDAIKGFSYTPHGDYLLRVYYNWCIYQGYFINSCTSQLSPDIFYLREPNLSYFISEATYAFVRRVEKVC